MIDRSHDLPIKRQAALVNISRGSAYYTAKPVSDEDLKLMRRVDELHLELPFAGARMLHDLLRGEGIAVGRKHMTTLMRRMGTRYGTPEIFNTDQGSQFTSAAFTGLLTDHGIPVSRWTARAAGATTCSSSGCGARSSTRRCTCMPTRA